MKFKDKMTGNTLETENKFSIEQYMKYPDRYESVRDDGKKAKPEPGDAGK